MRGMIIFAGLVEMFMAPVIRRLRVLFPPVVVGMVVMMVGVSIVPLVVTNFFGAVYAGDSLRLGDLAIGGISLAVMVGLNIWGKGAWKMYCLLIGVLAGCVLSAVLSHEFIGDIQSVSGQPFFSLPIHNFSEVFSYSFDPGLLLTFFIIAISGSLKSFGNLMAAQKISEPGRDELNMKPISKGLMADGFTTAMAGAMGALAVDTSSSNVGLAGATGAVSRWIGVLAGAIFTIMAFFPAVSHVIAVIPRPVVGASLVFAVSFMICTGLSEILEHALDQRDVFVVGISIIFGLSTKFTPGLYAMFPPEAAAFFDSPLQTTTIFGVVLYQVLHFDNIFNKLKIWVKAEKRQGSDSGL